MQGFHVSKDVWNPHIEHVEEHFRTVLLQLRYASYLNLYFPLSLNMEQKGIRVYLRFKRPGNLNEYGMQVSAPLNTRPAYCSELGGATPLLKESGNKAYFCCT